MNGHAVIDERFDGDHKVSVGFSDVLLTDVKSYLTENQNVSFIVGAIHKSYSEIPGANYWSTAFRC
jgi:hypothetical protein